MVKFSFSRNFPDLEIHDHKSRLKLSREIGYLAIEQERQNIHDPFAVVEGSLMSPWDPANDLPVLEK